MKYSLRKSFNARRRKEITDDDHNHQRIDPHGLSNSNSTLVKSKKSKSFLGRRRRCSSSSPDRSKPKESEQHAYSNHFDHVADDDNDGDDDPFTASAKTKSRIRPFDKLTYQIRKSFRNTLSRQRPRLESTNSNKHLIMKKNDEHPPIDTTIPQLSTGLTSPLIYSIEATTITKENDKLKISPKQRKAPLAPIHISQSASVPNSNTSTLFTNDHPILDCEPSLNEQQENSIAAKNKHNKSLRMRLSHLLKKRHEKKQRQHVQIENCTDEDHDHLSHGDHEEMIREKQTLSQRFNSLRRSFHLGSRNSTSKGKRHLLSNE